MHLARKIREGARWLDSRRDRLGAVLLYHRVSDDHVASERPSPVPRDPFRLCVHPEHFEGHVELLARTRTTFSADVFADRLRHASLPAGAVSPTFDDGYLDVFETALPILERHDVPATVFITTGQLGKRFWWDRLADIVFGGGRPCEALRLDDATIAVGSDTPRRRVYEELHHHLRPCEPERREDLLGLLAQQLGCDPNPGGARCASAEEIARYAKHPLISIGAHTESHSRLTGLRPTDQAREIRRSIERLEEIAGREIRSFSYPFGLWGRDYDLRSVEAAKEAGASCAFAADRGAVTRRTDPFRIPRLWIHDQEQSALERQLRLWIGRNASASIGLAS